MTKEEAMRPVAKTTKNSLTQEEARQAETTATALNRLLETKDASFQNAILRLYLPQPDGKQAEL